jgi:hypothetical protein
MNLGAAEAYRRSSPDKSSSNSISKLLREVLQLTLNC